ncbi:acyl carrier protein, partial [Methylogaea oryzae]|uniref:acyl carrier protein n=1 Tax=Methylogaea oryzae TaxID=1295382 RepID=UPI000A47D427
PAAPGAAGKPEVPVEGGIAQEIAQLWQELLNIEAVGAHDRFFDVGGHSLLMPQVQSRLEARFGVTIPIVKLFEHPTVHALAGYIAGLLGGQISR